MSSNAPVETKVAAASTTALVAAFVIGWVGTAVFHGAVPDWLIGAIDGAVTAAAAFVAGWLAKHTTRPSDPPAA